MMLKYKSIAVDYDDTLVWENKDTYPHSDSINKFAFEVLKKYKNKGGKIILFTCRSDEDLVVALNTCSQNGLEFDAVNTDMQSTIDAWRIKRPHSSISPKPYVDMYIDDKAYPNCVKGIDWAMLAIELMKEE